MALWHSELSFNASSLGWIHSVTGFWKIISYPLIQLNITESVVRSFKSLNNFSDIQLFSLPLCFGMSTPCRVFAWFNGRPSLDLSSIAEIDCSFGIVPFSVNHLSWNSHGIITLVSRRGSGGLHNLVVFLYIVKLTNLFPFFPLIWLLLTFRQGRFQIKESGVVSCKIFLY